MPKIRSGLLGAAIVASLLTSFPTAGFAFQPTAAQRAACSGDAFRLCSSAIPNMDRIAVCMRAKKDQLSAGCKAQFARG
jgi:hypothetical protein